MPFVIWMETGSFWPYAIYEYDPASDTYVLKYAMDAWEKKGLHIKPSEIILLLSAVCRRKIKTGGIECKNESGKPEHTAGAA